MFHLCANFAARAGLRACPNSEIYYICRRHPYYECPISVDSDIRGLLTSIIHDA